MGARRPEDIHHLFGTAFNQRDIETIMALYEPECELMPQPGQVARGRSAIRSSLQKFLASEGMMDMKSVFIILGSDLALLRSQWKLTGTGPDGKPVDMAGQSIEVARRQLNGEWLLAIDHPFGAD